MQCRGDHLRPLELEGLLQHPLEHVGARLLPRRDRAQLRLEEISTVPVDGVLEPTLERGLAKDALEDSLADMVAPAEVEELDEGPLVVERPLELVRLRALLVEALDLRKDLGAARPLLGDLTVAHVLGIRGRELAGVGGKHGDDALAHRTQHRVERPGTALDHQQHCRRRVLLLQLLLQRVENLQFGSEFVAGAADEIRLVDEQKPGKQAHQHGGERTSVAVACRVACARWRRLARRRRWQRTVCGWAPGPQPPTC